MFEFLRYWALYPQGSLLLLVAVVNLGWLWYVLKIGFLKRLVSVYATYAFCGFLWIITNAYFQLPSLLAYGEELAVKIALISNISGCFVTLILFYLSCLIRELEPAKSVKIMAYMIMIGGTNLVINLWPGMTVTGVDVVGVGQFTLLQGPLANLFFLITAVSIIPTIYNFAKAVGREPSIEHTRNLYILIGTILMYVSALSGNMFLPMLFDKYDTAWVAPALSTAEVLIVGYALAVSRFINLRLFVHTTLSYSLNGLAYGLPALALVNSLLSNHVSVNGFFVAQIIWIIFIYFGWSRTLELFKDWSDYLLYNGRENPLQGISKTLENFQNSLQSGLESLGQVFAVEKAELVFVGDVSTSAKKHLLAYYESNEHTDVIVTDELLYEGDKLGAKSALVPELEAEMIAAVVPVLDNQKRLLGILLLERKLKKNVFSSQEINATKQLLKRANIYISRERDYSRNLEKLKEKGHAEKDFLDGLMHEIRHPLMMARNVSEIIDWAQLKPEDQEFIKKSEMSLQGLSKKLEKITEASDWVKDAISVQKTIGSLVQLRQFVREDMQKKEPNWLDLGEFKWESSDLEKDLFYFDMNQMKRVFIELGKNALFFKREEKVKLKANAFVEGKNVVVHYSDNGIGIAKKNWEKIFDLMFVVSSSRNENESGLGLGLTIARGIMRAHGGDIKVLKSRLGHGTTFEIKAPLERYKN